MIVHEMDQKYAITNHEGTFYISKKDLSDNRIDLLDIYESWKANTILIEFKDGIKVMLLNYSDFIEYLGVKP